MVLHVVPAPGITAVAFPTTPRPAAQEAALTWGLERLHLLPRRQDKDRVSPGVCCSEQEAAQPSLPLSLAFCFKSVSLSHTKPFGTNSKKQVCSGGDVQHSNKPFLPVRQQPRFRGPTWTLMSYTCFCSCSVLEQQGGRCGVPCTVKSPFRVLRGNWGHSLGRPQQRLQLTGGHPMLTDSSPLCTRHGGRCLGWCGGMSLPSFSLKSSGKERH